MKIQISSPAAHNVGCPYVVSLEAEPPPTGDFNSTFFTLHASPLGAEAVLFLRAEDLYALHAALGDCIFNEEQEIQQ